MTVYTKNGFSVFNITKKKMSQNNYILIQQKLPDLYEISDRDADTNCAGKIYTEKTLEKAIEKAKELESECWLGSSEYGIQINLLSKLKAKE